MRKDDAGVLVRVTATAMRSGGEVVGVVVVAHDHAALADEEGTRRVADQFRTVLEASPVPTAITRLADGRILYGNRAMAEALRWERDELVGRTTAEIDLWADPGNRPRMVERLARDGRIYAMEERLRRKDGEVFPVITSIEVIEFDGERCLVGLFHDISERVAAEEALVEEGRVAALGGIATDITERRRLEREAQEAAEQVRLLLDSTAEWILGVDAEGRCTFVNPAAAAALGLNPAELVGAPVHELVQHHRADGSPYPWEECPTYRTLRSGEELRVDDEVFWRADGSRFPVGYASRPVRSGEGIVGAVVSFTDIAERKRWEAELAAARDAALERMGYRVDAVGNGAEAVAAVEAVAYDAVVMDCEMPVVDGYQAAGEIRRREPAGRRVPIVAVTASVLESDVERALAAGMDAHVGEPIDRDELERTLTRLVGRPGPSSGPDQERTLEEEPVGVGENETLDQTALAALRDLDGGDTLRQLVEIFQREAPRRMEQLVVAVAAGDAGGAAAAAHSLTGSAATFGAVRTAEMARAIEQLGKRGVLPSPAAVAALERALASANGALARLVGASTEP